MQRALSGVRCVHGVDFARTDPILQQSGGANG